MPAEVGLAVEMPLVEEDEPTETTEIEEIYGALTLRADGRRRAEEDEEFDDEEFESEEGEEELEEDFDDEDFEEEEFDEDEDDLDDDFSDDDEDI